MLGFIGCVEAIIRQIIQTPEGWRVFEADVLRCLTKVFPYAPLLYTIEVDSILIVAVMHVGVSLAMGCGGSKMANKERMARRQKPLN